MKDKGRILFPVDLTESSEKLIPRVVTMVRKFDAELHILFVVRIFQYFSSIYVPHPSINLFENELVEGAHKKMDEFVQARFPRMPNLTSEVILGDPAETILEYIESKKMDMVIMGTHGRKGLDRVIFGSVAERVIKTSPVPVLVINPFREG
ncbi:MAG: universal stress protein [Desulfosarcinaceae bacterium]|jgi:nucleotide-binding universal stress UspA family protein